MNDEVTDVGGLLRMRPCEQDLREAVNRHTAAEREVERLEEAIPHLKKLADVEATWVQRLAAYRDETDLVIARLRAEVRMLKGKLGTDE